MALERTAVVSAALELLDEVGFDRLTIRRLAEKLGVQGPALYWHFKNKQELIDQMAVVLLHDAYRSPDPGEDWAEWLTEGARRMRRALLSYRDGPRLLAGYRPSEPPSQLMSRPAFGYMVAAGFPPGDAIWALITVAQFAFGWSMDEQAAAGRPPPPDPRMTAEAGFEFGLSVIVEGLRTRLHSHRAAGFSQD
jgi:TetR/AcrR family transcriptional regulator, tetracycline repressor protein